MTRVKRLSRKTRYGLNAIIVRKKLTCRRRRGSSLGSLNGLTTGLGADGWAAGLGADGWAAGLGADSWWIGAAALAPE